MNRFHLTNNVRRRRWTRDRRLSSLACKVILVALLVTASSSATSTAQSFFVRGEVLLNRSTGEPAVAATVFIPGTLFGGITDDNGRFEIGPVPAGEYTIRAHVSGFKETLVQIDIADRDLDLILILRRADVDLDEQTIAAGFLSRRSQRHFLQPGGLIELLRSDSDFEVSRLGWISGRVASREPTGPFGRTAVSIDRVSTGTNWSLVDRFEEIVPLGRLYLRSARGEPGSVTLLAEDESPLPRRFPSVKVETGVHSNGRMIDAGVSVDGSAGRLSYEAGVKRLKADNYGTGADQVVEASLRRSAVGGSVAFRLSPFSDIGVHYDGVFDGLSYQTASPLVQDKLSGHRSAVVFRHANPDATFYGVSATLTVGRTNDEISRRMPDVQRYPFATTTAQFVASVLEGSHRLFNHAQGEFLVSARYASNDPVFPTSSDSAFLDQWTETSLRGRYRSHIAIEDVDVRASVTLERTQFETESTQKSLSGITSSLILSPNLSFPVSPTVTVSTRSRLPTAAQLFGVAIPTQIGQRFAELNGNSSLRPERINTVLIRLETVTPTRSLAVSGAVTNLHRYTTAVRVNSDNEFVQSSGTAISLSGEVSVAAPPYAQVALSGFWSRGVDHVLDMDVLGTRSPRMELKARLQAPGGSVYLQPELRGVFARAAADTTWESETAAAVRLDLTAGFSRRGAHWTLGVSNLGDATWRYHSSPFLSESSSRQFEPGRSFFLRFSRTF